MPFLPSGGGGGGSVTDPDVMKKSVYDIDNDNIVDKSKSLDDGQGNVKTAEEVKNHIDNASIHPQIDDTTPATQKVFSSQKVSNELANKSDIGHTHDDRYYTESETDSLLSGKADINHTHPWDDIDKTGSKLSDIADVDISSLGDGQVLKWDGTNNKWISADESGGSSGASLWSDIDKTGSKLSDIEDVSTSGLADGKVLKWSETQQKWVPADDEVGSGEGGNSEVVTKTKWTDYDVANIQRDSDYSFTPQNENLTVHDIFTVGRPLRYKEDGESDWQYGMVLNYPENGSVTISGAPLPSSIYALQYGEPESIVVKNIFINEDPLTLSVIENGDLCEGGNYGGHLYSSTASVSQLYDNNTGNQAEIYANDYFYYSWTEGKIVNKYRIYVTSGTDYPKDWKFEGSNDGTNWVTLDTRTGEHPSTGWSEYTFQNSIAYKYYRFFLTHAYNTVAYISEIEYYEQSIVDKYEHSMKKQFIWSYPKAYLVQVRARVKTPPQNGNIRLNIGHNDINSDILNSDLVLGDSSWVEATNNIDATKYQIQKGDRIFLNLSQLGTDYAGGYLQLQFIFVLDGLDITETLEAPQLSGDSEVFESDSITNTITNYDPLASYSVTFSDPLLSGSISGDTITINAGDITDNQDHIVNMTVTVSKIGYYSNSTTKAITVKYYEGVADDALLISGSTYTAGSFDVINNGTLS